MRTDSTAVVRRYLVLELGVGAALFNLAANALLGWWIAESVDYVPFWGNPGLAIETLGMLFLIPALTVLAVTPTARRRLRDGSLPALHWMPPQSLQISEGLLLRAAATGGVCTILLGPAVLVAMRMAGIEGLDDRAFVAAKAGFAALLAAAVTPCVGIVALSVPPFPR